MYKIAVCDDEPVFIDSFIKMIHNSFAEEGMQEGQDYSVDAYTDPSVFFEALSRDPEAYHLILLDIVLGDENGVKMAALLRKKRMKAAIIYISSYEDFVFQSFDTRPLHYLLKPVDQQKLKSVMMEHYREGQKRPLLHLKGVSLPIPTDEIYYLESIRHKVEVHLKDRIISGSGPIGAIEKELPEKYFCRCHVGYIVNFSYVFNLSRYSITLNDGRKVPVSRRLYQHTTEKYADYLLKE